MAAEHDVRRVRWGMSREQVMSNESADVADATEDSGVLYRTSLIGSDCNLLYGFVGGELASAAYIFDHHNDVVDVNDFFELKEMLDKKYGVTTLVPQWKNPYRRVDIDTASDIADAVSSGLLSVLCEWETSRTELRLYLTEDPSKYNAKVWLMYKSREHAALEDANRRDEELDLL